MNVQEKILETVAKAISQQNDHLEREAKIFIGCGYRLDELMIVVEPGGVKRVCPKKWLDDGIEYGPPKIPDAVVPEFVRNGF